MNDQDLDQQSSTLFASLEKWAVESAKIDPSQFACAYYDECNASTGGLLGNGSGCTLSYVGPEYGTGFRVAIVGMDHGDYESASLKERQQGILDWYAVRKAGFNPHYAGVVKTAAAILGADGEHCRDQCTRRCEKASNSVCVLDRISQPNLVKCAPSNQINRTSITTWEMKTNCSKVLLEEIGILKPNLIVFHGNQSKHVVTSEFAKTGVEFSPPTGMPSAADGMLYFSKTIGAHFLFLSHPSRGWLARQWSQVEICLNWMRSQAIIPALSHFTKPAVQPV